MRDHVRTGVWTIDVDGTERLELYWRKDDFGVGPALSFHRGDREVLRFDFLHPAHVHRASEQDAPRHYYPPDLPMRDYVAMAIAEIAAESAAAGAVAASNQDEITRRCQTGQPAFEP